MGTPIREFYHLYHQLTFSQTRLSPAAKSELRKALLWLDRSSPLADWFYAGSLGEGHPSEQKHPSIFRTQAKTCWDMFHSVLTHSTLTYHIISATTHWTLSNHHQHLNCWALSICLIVFHDLIRRPHICLSMTTQLRYVHWRGVFRHHCNYHHEVFSTHF